MNGKILSVVGIFLTSCIIGYNLIPTTEVIQARPPVFIPVELPPLANKPIEEEKAEEVDVDIDLSTLEVKVKGNTATKVNVNMTGEPKPVIKWKTKVIEKVIKDGTGYPYMKHMGQIPDSVKPTPILKVMNKYEQ